MNFYLKIGKNILKDVFKEYIHLFSTNPITVSESCLKGSRPLTTLTRPFLAIWEKSRWTILRRIPFCKLNWNSDQSNHVRPPKTFEDETFFNESNRRNRTVEEATFALSLLSTSNRSRYRESMCKLPSSCGNPFLSRDRVEIRAWRNTKTFNFNFTVLFRKEKSNFSIRKKLRARYLCDSQLRLSIFRLQHLINSYRMTLGKRL